MEDEEVMEIVEKAKNQEIGNKNLQIFNLKSKANKQQNFSLQNKVRLEEKH